MYCKSQTLISIKRTLYINEGSSEWGDNSKEKWARNLNRHVTKNDIQVANKYNKVLELQREAN